MVEAMNDLYCIAHASHARLEQGTARFAPSQLVQSFRLAWQIAPGVGHGRG